MFHNLHHFDTFYWSHAKGTHKSILKLIQIKISGGSEIISYMHKLLQLKYPVHVNAITMSRIEEILQEHSSIALDYQEEIRKWANPDYYEANVKRVQLPFVQSSSSSGLTGLLCFK